MRKLTPIPIILMVIASIVLASGVLFPDTPTLPRLPTGSGTIGGILSSLFDSDGTAQNTKMLSGVYASGYLHNMDCSSEPLNKVWVGIDADGQGICGNVAKLIGILTEQSGLVEVSRDGGLIYSTVPTGTPLYEGDLIRSDPSGTGMIRFAADFSLLRFATGTNLELDIGELDGQTVAEVILSSGRLWGRILSSTGVNLGGGGMVTGVRGTSVDLQMLAGGIYRVNTVSSASILNKMSKVDISVGGTKNYDPIAAASYFGSGTLVTYMSGATTVSRASPLLSLSSLSYADSWIRKNTFMDIDYLSNLLALPVAVASPDIIRINTELDNTLVQGNPDVTAALLQDGAIAAGNIFDAALLLDSETASDNKNNAKALNCKMQGQTYFPSMPSNTTTEYCEGHWNTLWTTMNLTSTGNLNGYGSHGDIYTTSGVSTNIIDDTGKYLQYALDSGELASLTGKTITIELANSVGHEIPSPTSYKWYIMDLGSGNQYYVSYNKTCSGGATIGRFICKSGTSTPIDTYDDSKKTFSFNITIPPGKFVIGASYVGVYNNPIGTTIKRVSIQ